MVHMVHFCFFFIINNTHGKTLFRTHVFIKTKNGKQKRIEWKQNKVLVWSQTRWDKPARMSLDSGRINASAYAKTQIVGYYHFSFGV